MYNEEIQRLQQAELSLDELEKEESLYIQEHKLKRKVSLEFDAACGCAGSEWCVTSCNKNLYTRLCGI